MDHETASEPPSELQINGLDSPLAPEVLPDYDGLRSELESLRSYENFKSQSRALEETLVLLQHERDEAVNRNAELIESVEEIRSDRDHLRSKGDRLEAALREKEDEFVKKLDEEAKEKEELKNEVEGCREKNGKLESEKQEKNRVLKKCLQSTKNYLIRVGNCFDDEKVKSEEIEDDKMSFEVEIDEESRSVMEDIKAVEKLSELMEMKVNEYREMRKKEKRELENSVVSLTEENRDINSLLRIALVEKEAVEKSLNRLKGNNEQKRVAILQIAERGLQRVGFGFMMGSGSNEQISDSSGSNVGNKVDGYGVSTGSKSDNSESEEEVVSLASTVERIMKNLRLEITQLRRSLEESRSDIERLLSLTQKQAQTIAENTLYINELEDRERVLAQNVDELLMEIKETEAEVARWREACELEVGAGKREIVDRDKVVTILKQELEKTKAALDISNGKLKLKEELAATAMAAQAAAERSLQLADSRASSLRERIEELTRQLEEAERRERNNHRVRHICWPWRTLKANPANIRVRNVRRMLPEMQALLPTV